MPNTRAKENILKRIRAALAQPTPQPFPQTDGHSPLYPAAQDDDAVLFAEAFTQLQGKFVYCTDMSDVLTRLQILVRQKGWTRIYCREPRFIPLILAMELEPFSDLAQCDASITGCEYLVSRTGTIVMSTAQPSGRTTSVYAPVHLCIASSTQLVHDHREALQFLKMKYTGKMPSLITFATGPSRTADIEKTLVTGVHGPKEVYCFLTED